MRRTLLLALLLLVVIAVAAFQQQNFGSSLPTGWTTSGAVMLLPNNNSCSAPALSFTGQTGEGISMQSNRVALCSGNAFAASATNIAALGANGLLVANLADTATGNNGINFVAGYVNVAGSGNPLLTTPNNHAILAGDFTDANASGLQVITGLAIPLGATSKKWGFHCSLMYSQATASAGDQFGVAVLTTAPTNTSVFGTAYTNTGAAAPITTGVLTNLATTTPTAVVTFTPAVTSVLGATLDGGVETAGAGAATLQFYVTNGTAANVIVIGRDSACNVW